MIPAGMLHLHQTLTAFHSYQQLTLGILQPTLLSHGAEIYGRMVLKNIVASNIFTKCFKKIFQEKDYPPCKLSDLLLIISLRKAKCSQRR